MPGDNDGITEREPISDRCDGGSQDIHVTFYKPLTGYGDRGRLRPRRVRRLLRLRVTKATAARKALATAAATAATTAGYGCYRGFDSFDN